MMVTRKINRGHQLVFHQLGLCRKHYNNDKVCYSIRVIGMHLNDNLDLYPADSFRPVIRDILEGTLHAR
jgi:hypothetical protein